MKAKQFEVIVRTKGGNQHYLNLYGCKDGKAALVLLFSIIQKPLIDGLFIHEYNSAHKYEIETAN